MFDPMEMLRKAADANAISDMAKKFGISTDEATRGMQALLPAFAMGLERLAAAPETFVNAVKQAQTMGQEAMSKGLEASATSMQIGQQMTSAVFGSADIAKEIAEKAAEASGVSAQVLQQMMAATTASLVPAQSAIASGVASAAKSLTDVASALQAAFLPKQATGLANSLSAIASHIAHAGKAAQEASAQSAAGTPFDHLFKSGTALQADYLNALQAIFDQKPKS